MILHSEADFLLLPIVILRKTRCNIWISLYQFESWYWYPMIFLRDTSVFRSLRSRLYLGIYGWQTGFLRRMLFSVVTAQGYEERVDSKRTWFIFYFHRDLARGARILAFIDPYCVSFSLCSYFILLIHVCSQWSREVNILPGMKGLPSSPKSFCLIRLAKLDCAWVQFSEILSGSFCNRFWKINSVSFIWRDFML